VRKVSAADAHALNPTLREGYVAAAMFEPDGKDIDVGALHQAYLRGVRRAGGEVVVDAEVTAMERVDGGWKVQTRAGTFSAPVVVNAAGAWADGIAGLAGIAPVGLTPMRRTAITFDAPEKYRPSTPLTVDAEERFYFKPESGRILASPADETPMPPCDVQPDEMDVAILVDRIERATDMSIRRVEHKWAGLRTFAPDRTPVVGPEPGGAGFIWFAGQGGYGIQTSPAMGAALKGVIENGDLPAELRERGLSAAVLSPARFR